MKIGYNTNGFAHHRLEDAIEILAELGYEAVALTLDFHALNPFDRDLFAQMNRIRKLLDRCKMACIVETGSRFLLDTKRKHQPTLISPEQWQRDYRAEFLRRCIWIASSLDAKAVSLWSGTPTDDLPEQHWLRLQDGLSSLCDVAADYGITLAFEPEPGMLVDTMEKFDRLVKAVNRPELKLTIDVGHLQFNGEPIAETIRKQRANLVNVHLDDMQKGVHDHLMFGEGEIEFATVLDALHEIGYDGIASVELSRHSHDAVETARKALGFLRAVR